MAKQPSKCAPAPSVKQPHSRMTTANSSSQVCQCRCDANTHRLYLTSSPCTQPEPEDRPTEQTCCTAAAFEQQLVHQGESKTPAALCQQLHGAEGLVHLNIHRCSKVMTNACHPGIHCDVPPGCDNYAWPCTCKDTTHRAKTHPHGPDRPCHIPGQL